MKIEVLGSYDEISARAADIVLAGLKANHRLLLGAATGNSPTGLYARLAESARKSPALFSELRVMKLDEWYGLPPTDPATCESYIRKNLLQPLKIGHDRYFSFDSDAEDAGSECVALRDMLDREGPIDVCVLGLGTNGHIAFNEPAPALAAHPHVATLAKSSQNHSMVAGRAVTPDRGLTIGMAGILKSRMILLLVSGASKREIFQSLRSPVISTEIPASFLWLHPNAICMVDREANGS